MPVNLSPIRPQVNQEAIDKLRLYLKQAQKGEIQSFIMVVDKGGNRQAIRQAGDMDLMKSVGMLEWAKLSILEDIGFVVSTEQIPRSDNES